MTGINRDGEMTGTGPEAAMVPIHGKPGEYLALAQDLTLTCVGCGCAPGAMGMPGESAEDLLTRFLAATRTWTCKCGLVAR